MADSARKEADAAPAKTADRAGGVTFRAIVLGLILIPLNNWWIFYMEIVYLSGMPTTTSLFFNAVFVLVLLLCVNVALRRVAPR